MDMTQALKKIMIDRRISGQALADKCGMQPSNISRAIHGGVKISGVLLRVCAALDCTLHVVITDTQTGDTYAITDA